MCAMAKAFMRQGSRESTMTDADSAESVWGEFVLVNRDELNQWRCVRECANVCDSIHVARIA